ncbi:MAG: HypC/HybG/HupF family hydrogenase formation chaperone [Burkholderiales bacterium]|jgi:hydrogenase expression/formation protein HypC|nr:MAG: HypC/HybG/HupF family hydrogenase formation chaperone [Burkholderiales bacterium]
MCLALPARVIEMDATGQHGTVDMGGVRKQVSLALLDQVQLGDYVIVHVGYALTLLDQAEAEQTLALFGQIAQMNAAP